MRKPVLKQEDKNTQKTQNNDFQHFNFQARYSQPLLHNQNLVMNTHQISISDCNILLKLFHADIAEVHFFDPNSRLVFDQSLFQGHPTGKQKILISTAQQITSFKHFNLADFDAVIDFGNTNLEAYKYKSTFHSIHNPNHTIRWLFESHNNTPGFLKFYNNQSLKAKCYKTCLKLAFKMGLKKLFISNTFNVFHQNPLEVQKTTKQFNAKSYSIFTGTIGEHRKAIIEFTDDKNNNFFIKKAISNKSVELLKNEATISKKLAEIAPSSLVVKESDLIDKTTLITPSNKPKKAIISNAINSLSIDAFNALYKQTAHKDNPNKYYKAKNISKAIQLIKHNTRFNENKEIAQRLNILHKSLSKQKSITLGFAHRDFTPWNIYQTNEHMHMYDLELADFKTPLLFDLFHYIFQDLCLTRRKSYTQIKQALETLQHKTEVQDLLNAFDLDFNIQLKAYLLEQISMQLCGYTKQKSLHKQVFWLIEIWLSALKDQTCLPTKEERRKTFIPKFLTFLQDQRHVMLKQIASLPHKIDSSSDLDILVLKEHLNTTIDFIKTECSKATVRVQKKSFMHVVEIYFSDQSFLSIDLIHAFKRKALVMCDAKPFLVSAYNQTSMIRKPQLRFDVEYMVLFYILNGASLPEKYIQHITHQSLREQHKTLNYLNQKYQLNHEKLDDYFTFSKGLKKHLTRQIKQAQSFVERLKAQGLYVKDTCSSLFQKKGVVITFSGVDGAGKSTIIEQVKEKLTNTYRKKVVVLRHRPSMLPILSTYIYGHKEAQKRVVSKLPRSGQNKSTFSSLLRFSYYFLDYLFGQVYIYFRYQLRGTIVLYDRYYYDFINDAKRSNIHLNQKFLTVLFNLVYTPELNFFLYAPAHVILERKKELKAHTIGTLTEKYLRLFKRFKNTYRDAQFISIENIEKHKTLQIIYKHIQAA